MTVTVAQQQGLMKRARAAARSAYCPYSHFPVGAALLLDNGQILTGTNIENASYGLTICAERVALFKAVTEGRKVKALAVSCLKGDPMQPETLMPCGACRQVMHELVDPQTIVVVDGVDRTFTIQKLLPDAFTLTGNTDR